MADEPLEPPLEEEEGGPVKPFLDHLEDLRWVLIKCIASLIVGMTVCMVGAPYLVEWLRRPLPHGIRLEWLGPAESFMVSMKIALYGGIVLALPLMLYVIGSFVLPALKRTEKKYFVQAISVGAFLF